MGERSRRRQRGFSLIVVFLLVLVLVGIAAAVLVSTQGDLQVAGQDREAAVSFYAAEAGVAFAKDWVATQNIGTGSSAFSALLQAGSNPLCQPGNGAAPGTRPKAGNGSKTLGGRTMFDAPRTADYRFCVHNNADDPKYFNKVPTGDTNDGDGTLQIEAFGWGPEGSYSHISVQITSGQSGATINDYIRQGGDCGRKNYAGEASPNGIAAGLSHSVTF